MVVQVISDDILIDILVRIPWKSAVKFKLVSKDWLRLISTQYFVSNYQARNFSLMGIHYKEGSTQKFIPTDDDDDSEFITKKAVFRNFDNTIASYCYSLNSSNGLLLCYYPSDFYVIYNPINGQYSCQISLPNTPHIRYGEYVSGRGKTRYGRYGEYVGGRGKTIPKRQLFIVQGFLFDPFSNPPCLTVTELFSDTHSLYVSTYRSSSETTKWIQTTHENVLPYLGSDCCMLVGRSTYLKGAFHWICAATFGRILAYDINTDNFRLLCIPCDHNKDDYPKECMESSSNDFLGEMSDKLFYTRIANDYSIHLWIQDDYYRDIWSPRRCIVMYNLRNKGPLREVIDFDPKNTQVVYLRSATRIVSYNIQSGEYKELCILSYNELSGSRRCCAYQLPRSPTVMPQITFYSDHQGWKSSMIDRFSRIGI